MKVRKVKTAHKVKIGTPIVKMPRPKVNYDHWLVLVMRRNGQYRMEEVDGSITEYVLDGHHYEFAPSCAYRLAGWFPWQPITMNPFRFLWYWLQRRLVSVGVLFYEELPDAPDPDLLITPITHANHVTKGYDRIHPKLFRGAILSPLYKRYEKVRFGVIPTSTKTLLLIFGAFAAVVLVLYFAGVWG